MNHKSFIFVLFFALALCFMPARDVFAGHGDQKKTDALEHGVAYFFDLRDRESYIQVTNTDTDSAVLHIQIWNVNDNCNENNFFDAFTPNDTHVYNMRDIQTNDGSNAGVVLPEDAYGAVVIYVTTPNDLTNPDGDREILMGNLRILDDNGNEYRTNGSGLHGGDQKTTFPTYTFNFNTVSGVTLSDVVHFRTVGNEGDGDNNEGFNLSDILDARMPFEVNILDLNENIFSCRNVIFSCVDQEHPLLEALLEEVAMGDQSDDDDDPGASVASFEYGINNALPHSRGAPLLCPGNTISEGVVTLDPLSEDREDSGSNLASFIGLNNGNGRGSFDMWWQTNSKVSSPEE